MTEFELIRRFTGPAPQGGPGVVLGIGDDCAVLRPPAGELILATVDAVVEGVHFDARFTPAEVGWKALAVNLSDLAAMGARPLWALCALAVPEGADPRRLAAIGRGLAACARRHGVALAGGNVTRARDLSLTVTALGSAPADRVLRRDGASPGDVLLVSGTVGDAALGLAPGAAGPLARRQRRPTPRLALGRALGPLATACIDLSDGLAQDLGHLCAASGAGARVELARLPLSPAARRALREAEDPWAAPVSGGEDYELCVAVPEARVRAALAAARQARTPLTPVGVLTRGRAVVLLAPGGARYRPARAGYDHLALHR